MGAAGTLWVVATPIGNLGDVSARAIATLKAVDLIACEDTRHSGTLLAHLGVEAALVSLNDHNEAARVGGLIERLTAGESIALISDAGTPLISDPGYRLVRAAREAGIEVRPVPGACAAIAALSVAGIASDRFLFEGFLPAQAAARDKRLQALIDAPATLIFYESTHRIVASLQAMLNAFGADRRAFLGREMTKQFEEFHAGTLADISAHCALPEAETRGEFVIVVAASDAAESDSTSVDARALFRALCDELSPSQAAKITAKVCGLKRSEVYAWHPQS